MRTSTPQSAKVKTEVAGLGTDSWTQNCIGPGCILPTDYRPERQRLPALYADPSLDAQRPADRLGSWTELKHDTILYAKQVMAEMGGGGPQTPPHGYVEPNPKPMPACWLWHK